MKNSRLKYTGESNILGRGLGSEARLNNQGEGEHMRAIKQKQGQTEKADLESHRHPYNKKRNYKESKIAKRAELQNSTERENKLVILVNVIFLKLPNQSAN